MAPKETQIAYRHYSQVSSKSELDKSLRKDRARDANQDFEIILSSPKIFDLDSTLLVSFL